jgi:elongation factor 1 alpha-like protein
MITGAGQADCAILVINSITGEFETGFELGGQTREHSLLVKSLGVSQLVVAVNKMDMCDWSKDRFYDICKKLGNFLSKQVGFREADIIFVPCSGLIGENLTKKSTSEKLTW